MNLAELEAKIKAGTQVSDNERAYFITHNPYALFGFMIDNNPGSVNLILRKMGYNHLGFDPNKKALAAQVEILMQNKDLGALEAITKNFQLMDSNLTPNFVKALVAQLNTIK